MNQHVLAQSMLDSLRTLPSGFTTVPWIEPGTPRDVAIASLSGSGFGAPGGNAGSLAPVDGTDPAAGSVVKEGSTVALIAEGQAGPTESQTVAGVHVPDGAEPVNEVADVMGTWQLANGELGMTIGSNGNRYYQAFPIDCNSGSQPLRLDADGVVRLGDVMSTLIGCPHDPDYPQPSPLVEGQRLFLTPEGQLLALNPDGLVAATYVRSDQ
jgi:hypothetical protein